MKKILTLILSSLLCLILSSGVYAVSYQMHTIQTGDTYYNIGISKGVSPEKLEAINYQESKYLKAGELIIIKEIPTIKVNVNSQNIDFVREPYIENERVFVPIRFISEAFDVDSIDWIQETKTAIIKKDSTEIKLNIGSNIAHINEKPITLDAPAQLYIDTTFVPVRFISEAFGVQNLQWDSSSYTVLINKDDKSDIYDVLGQSQDNIVKEDSNVVEQAELTYSEEDLYWLSRIVNAEAADEPYEGKIAVANTIINRVKSPSFPNTIKDVIFDTKYAVQFTPITNGFIYHEPNEESVRAAKEALEGKNNVGECLYFLNPKTSINSWVINNRTYFNTIHNHDFYL